MKLKLLREKLTVLATQANHQIEEKGDAIWAPEDQTKFDNLMNEMSQIKAQISSIEKMREMEADNFFDNVVQQNSGGQSKDTASMAMALYLRFGNNVSPEQAMQINNAMSAGTGSEGGYTVPTEVNPMLIESMKAYGGMRNVCTVISTDSGNAWSYPTTDGTAEEGEIVAENVGASKGEVQFGTAPLNVFKYSSKYLALPLELIQDSSIDVVQFVMERLGMRLGRVGNRHQTAGTGVGEPHGIINRATVGKVGATGQAAKVTYDDMVDLKHSVNSAYRSNAGFMLNDLSVGVLSKVKDDHGRPIFVPSVDLAMPDMILGHKVVINDHMPEMAANAKSIVFGDFSKYIIRDVKNSTSIRRFDDSAFALNGQVGFCGWLRSGGNLMDVNAVKVYQNSAT